MNMKWTNKQLETMAIDLLKALSKKPDFSDPSYTFAAGDIFKPPIDPKVGEDDAEAVLDWAADAGLLARHNGQLYSFTSETVAKLDAYGKA